MTRAIEKTNLTPIQKEGENYNLQNNSSELTVGGVHLCIQEFFSPPPSRENNFGTKSNNFAESRCAKVVKKFHSDEDSARKYSLTSANSEDKVCLSTSSPIDLGNPLQISGWKDGEDGRVVSDAKRFSSENAERNTKTKTNSKSTKISCMSPPPFPQALPGRRAITPTGGFLRKRKFGAEFSGTTSTANGHVVNDFRISSTSNNSVSANLPQRPHSQGVNILTNPPSANSKKATNLACTEWKSLQGALADILINSNRGETGTTQNKISTPLHAEGKKSEKSIIPNLDANSLKEKQARTVYGISCLLPRKGAVTEELNARPELCQDLLDCEELFSSYNAKFKFDSNTKFKNYKECKVMNFESEQKLREILTLARQNLEHLMKLELGVNYLNKSSDWLNLACVRIGKVFECNPGEYLNVHARDLGDSSAMDDFDKMEAALDHVQTMISPSKNLKKKDITGGSRRSDNTVIKSKSAGGTPKYSQSTFSHSFSKKNQHVLNHWMCVGGREANSSISKSQDFENREIENFDKFPLCNSTNIIDSEDATRTSPIPPVKPYCLFLNYQDVK